MYKIIILYSLLVVLIIILVTWLCIKINSVIYYNVDKFPHMVELSERLKDNHEELKQISKQYMTTKEIREDIRKEGEWVGSQADDYVKTLTNNWIKSWTDGDNWLNYAIIYDGKYLPYISDEIKNIVGTEDQISKINVAGFSWIRPNGVIKPHTDDDTTYTKGRLAYHYVIFGEGTLIAGGKKKIQKEGEIIVFDPGYTHEVKNVTDDRIIFYCDFMTK